MKKLIVALMLYAGFANAITLTVDGVSKEVTDYSIAVTPSNITINTSSGSVVIAPTPEPEPEACTSTSTQTCGPSIDWTDFGPQITASLRGTSEVISWPLTTTTSSTHRGYVTISETVQQGSVSRKMWFSTVPNGPAVSSSCVSNGNSTRTIWWSQSYTRGYPCRLQPSTDYFLNVTNTYGCSSREACSFIRNLGS